MLYLNMIIFDEFKVGDSVVAEWDDWKRGSDGFYRRGVKDQLQRSFYRIEPVGYAKVVFNFKKAHEHIESDIDKFYYAIGLKCVLNYIRSPLQARFSKHVFHTNEWLSELV